MSTKVLPGQAIKVGKKSEVPFLVLEVDDEVFVYVFGEGTSVRVNASKPVTDEAGTEVKMLLLNETQERAWPRSLKGDANELAKRVREMLDARGITAAEFAEKEKMSKSSVYALTCAHKSYITPQMKVRLKRYGIEMPNDSPLFVHPHSR